MASQPSINAVARGTRGSTGQDAGFALIEVLVALVACSLVLTAYLATVGHSARASQTSNERLTAAAFAQSKLDALGPLDKLEVGTSEGAFDSRFRWRLQISEDNAVPRGAGPFRPLRVALQVYWRNHGREERVDYTTVKLLRASGDGDGY